MATPNTPSVVDYVVSATLDQVADVFNVEDLWQRARRRKSGEFLMDALARHLHARKNRHRRESRYFHIIVHIPKADYDRDVRLEDGFGQRTLVEDLVAIHQQKLGNYVPEGETVRYRIAADPTLASGQVRFVFGRAIFLPGDEAKPRYQLYQVAGGEVGMEALGQIYTGQRLTLLNGDPYSSTVVVPNWPFEASLLIISDPDQPPQVYAEPDASLEIRVEKPYTFHISDKQGNEFRLLLSAADTQPKPLVANDRTWVGGERTTTQAPLQVIGIALQRLSLYAEAGIAAWRMGFDRLGNLVGCQHPSTVAWLRMDAEDRLWGEVNACDPVTLVPPTLWQPMSALTLELHPVPEAMTGRYQGWLQLPQPTSLPLPREGWCCFGRGAGADLSPGLLADCHALRWQTTPHALNPEQLNLSRRHLSLCCHDKGWAVRLETDKLSAYRLSAQGELIQVLEPADKGIEFAVAAGERLVVGGYVLEVIKK